MEYIKEAEILLYEELCARPIREDKISKATIRFRENIKLAISVATKFSEPPDPAIDKEDIMQEAYLGLWRACLSFDDSKGYAFSTYATSMIEGTILKALYASGSVHTPTSFKQIKSALIRHGFTLPLSEEEISILVNEGRVSRAQILRYSEIDSVSLDTEVKGTDDLILADTIPDTAPDFQHEFSEEEIEQIVDKVISYIKPKYQDLIEEWIYATLGGYHITQRELGAKYNISRTSVLNILRDATEIISMHRDEIRDMIGI